MRDTNVTIHNKKKTKNARDTNGTIHKKKKNRECARH